MHPVKNKRENTVSTRLLPMRDTTHITILNLITHLITPTPTPIHITTVVITTPTLIFTPILISVVVLDSEDFEGAAEAEDVEDLDHIRGPPWGKFVPRAPIEQSMTAGSEMTLPFC